ncbi:UDP-glucuronosyltransferase 2B13-like [Contarinia nasturtii]|uniref:UDP-glucuronosyltransferase 2B13-like n=1 Tax=Contarinia nasturtii TaxID=265458 RepID=UPI0012D401B0|nr:UDP-glucuronosyltransferase 2B13-like [Contarinia nasturtii]
MKLIAVFVLFCVANAKAYKILGVFPVKMKSHFYVGNALMEGLARAGHDVTVISPFHAENSYNNYKEVFLDESPVENSVDYTNDNFMEYNNKFFWDIIMKWYDVGVEIARSALSSPNFQNFLKIKQNFDVIIVEHSIEALFGLSHHFNAPLIVISPFAVSKWSTHLVGTPLFASYVPYMNNPFSNHMTLWQRMYNSLTYWFEDVSMPLYLRPKHQKLMEKYFPNSKNWPSLEIIKRNVSLVLINTHVTYATALPLAPNMIEVGGMHIKQSPEPLSQKTQDFLDQAKDGAIYMSLGSNVLFNKLPKHKKDAILNAFSAYPNMRILIKSDEKIVIPSHKEADVTVESWFSQQSILAHHNLKIFITHGGLLSIIEAVYYGKPVIGISVFGDQHMNMQVVENKGYGLNIPIEKLNSENIKSAIGAIVQDTRYENQANLTSKRYRDLLKSPLETAIHWVEHVAKNKGAPHLKCAAVDLPFYVLYNLDVWFLLAVTGFSIVLVLKYIIHKIISMFTYNDKIKIKTR